MNTTSNLNQRSQAGREDDLLRGKNVALRPRRADDVALLHDSLYNDLAARSQADTRPWIPIPDSDPTLSPYSVTSVSDGVSFFSVVAHDGELVGEALLWGIDAHHRVAHIGLALLPTFRGRGWSGEVLQILCRYGFRVRGLNRLQLETLIGNEPMIRSAKRAGFTEEGVLRQAMWVLGSFADVIVMGLVASEWRDVADEPTQMGGDDP